MMKSILLLFVFLIPTTILSAQKKPAYRLYNSKGKKIKYNKMIKKVSDADVLFFGEQHNNPIAHWLQFEVTKELFTLRGQNLILAAEMIETDNQAQLDKYLKGEMTEEDFETEARLWNNYKTDYKPLVLFAKDNNLTFVASNIPRRYASMVYKKGIESLDTLDETTKAYIAPLPIEIDLELPGYQNMLKMMGGHGPANENFPKAQAVKDATMGYSITKYWSSGKYLIHYNGAYHSDNYEGTVWYVKKYNPTIKYKTITTVSQKDISKLEKENIGKADFIICVPENMTKTY